MKLVMGIDLGTSGLKTLVMDESGSVKAMGKCSYNYDTPCFGYAEQDPDDWWKHCCDAIRQALASCNGDDIISISFSGQMHGLVMLDKAMRPVRKAILHCDTRSARQVSELSHTLSEETLKNTLMNTVFTGYLLPSLLWVREHEPENYEKIRYVCLPKDYLKLKLTGIVSTDYSDASGTFAFDVQNLRWAESVLSRLGISSEIFPSCHASSDPVGKVTEEASRITGLPAGAEVIAGGGDQVMQNIGNGMLNAGDATINIGSSGQISFQTDLPVQNPKLNTNTFCGYKKGRWILLGATMTAGLSLKWWHNIIKDVDYKQMDRDISSIIPGSDGVIYLPYLNGERTPHMDPNLSGVLLGVNIGTTQAHITRAVMEGVTYSLMQAMEICSDLGYTADVLVSSGGGSRSLPWLQMQADILNVPVKVTVSEEQAGLGAALTAGVGVGLFSDYAEGSRLAVRYSDETVFPNTKNHELYQEYYVCFKKAYTANRDLLREINQIRHRC